MTNFFDYWYELDTLLEAKPRAGASSVNLNTMIDPATLGVTAKNNWWKILISKDCLTMINNFPKEDKAAIISKLNAQIPNISLNAKWQKSDFLKEHRYPIVEIKLGNGPTGQPIRLLGFTANAEGIRYYILGAALIHKGENLSKKERELCDSTYKEVNNLR